MATYSAKVTYKYGSGKATTTTSTSFSSLRGNTESLVLDELRKKHKTIKDLQIVVVRIEWK